ncbi:metallo-beta-lactamase family protein [Phycicoccus badiiscoriae]|uniref:Metallo-beta-lactamase family protein n=1 Tax=Pedococcus badiiscoriae TaxID=642776 RepID=A0A852WJE2_9MICO|nr:MBL fold metallo-hydrolase [Pedococcus badiiscoriae]NYG05656.1 metallo-beta-lactamase family protein [Pedococcus badiiscoriae]
MTLALTFLGAAGTVTGSKFLLDDRHSRVLVDCGLYQGERRWRRMNWEPLVAGPKSITDVVLTHAHLDHCGYLPALVRQGFAGPVWATAGTAALTEIVLRDSAHLQEEEAMFAQREGYSRHDPPQPLYTVADTERAIRLLRSCDFGQSTTLLSGAELSLTRAGHVLGSASALVTHGDTQVLFSGDLGRPQHPLLRGRSAPPVARTVVIESTYGDRTHPEEQDHEVLAGAIRRTIGRGGSIVIPAFAVDRTELVLLAIARLQIAGSIPEVPVYVDSPMALAALEVYRRPELAAELRSEALRDLATLRGVREARSADESKRLNNPGRPCIIISASGMASGGRVVHHLASLLPHPNNTVVLTGYQAAGTRGRALQEGVRQVKIHGQYVRVRAEVVVDSTFSVHADSAELVAWLAAMPQPPETVYLVHGEPESSAALAEQIRASLDTTVAVPRLGERVVLT